MASLSATVDSIRAAVYSTSTCTSVTATTLTYLLLPKGDSPKAGVSVSSTKGNVVRRGGRRQPRPPKPRGKIAVFADENKYAEKEELSTKERSVLATEVINATLKTLSDAIKAPPLRKKGSSKNLVKASARKVLRRSSSLPQSPSRRGSSNRVSSPPDFPHEKSKSISSASTISSGHRSTAQCARVAFSCLRTLQATKNAGVDLDPLQLESGMSILITKLIALDLDDLALQELRILKRRLDPGNNRIKKAGNAATAPQTLGELLDFGEGEVTEPKLGLAITTQLQVLRLLASSRKPRQIESVLKFLKPSYPSSPSNLVLLAAKACLKRDKAARQLQSLSEILFSLCPSVSTSDDVIALESRLSVSPEVALQFQVLALHSRSLWWQIAGHQGDLAKELSDPFLRCLSAFARRAQSDGREAYRISSESFLHLQSITSGVCEPESWPNSTLQRIYKVLSGLAREANRFDHAIDWTKKVKGLLDLKIDSEIKRCCIEARLTSLSLQRSFPLPEDEELMLALLEGLERPFKGESSEIDDLMTEVSSARRAAITILARRNASQEKGERLTEGMRGMCESLVLLCPRLYLRYLGNPPSEDSTTKDIVRHEQRCQFINKHGHNAIDSVLFLVRTLLTERGLVLDLIDSKLQDCLLLLARLESSANGTPLDSLTSPASYYVKMSNLYYSQFLNMRRDCSGTKEGHLVRPLRRSIDCVRNRSKQERNGALIATKLERMAELYKDTAQYDELFKTLLSLQNETIENGALKTVTTAAATMGFQAAWVETEEISLLSRTMRTLLKVRFKYLDSASQTSLLRGDWTNDERATILERYLEILSSQSRITGVASTFRAKIFQMLLDIYNRREYPVRRLRVLTRLLSLDIDSRKEMIDDIGAELDDLRLVDVDIGNSKDVGLREYLEYQRTLAISTLELQHKQPSIDTLKRNLVVWSSIRCRNANLEALQCHVEDIPGLLIHLQSVADYLQSMGLELIRLATLKLIAEYNEICANSPEDLVCSFVHLGSQWLQLGYSGKASLAFDKAQAYSHQNGIGTIALLQLNLSYSQYLLGIGNYDKSEDHLRRAHTIITGELNSAFTSPKTVEQGTAEKQVISNAYLIQSRLALERGVPQAAFIYAKQGLKLLRQAWLILQEHQKQQCSTRTEVDRLADETANLSISTIMNLATVEHQLQFGSIFWPLITPLFRTMSYLSTLYSNHGMFQETVYYADQAHNLVQEAGAGGHKATASAYLGDLWLRAGKLDKASEFLMVAQEHRMHTDQTRASALLFSHLGKMHSILGDREAAMEAFQNAETTLQALTESKFINTIDCLDPANAFEQILASLTISRVKIAAPGKVATRSKTVARRKTSTRVKIHLENSSSVAEECPDLLSLRADVLRQKAQAFASLKKFADANALLNEADDYSKTQTGLIEQGLAVAKQLLYQSIEQMHADPVYSVLQESTISFPSMVGNSKLDRHSGDRLFNVKTSPCPRQLTVRRGCGDLKSSKPAASDSFLDKLRQAHAHLVEVYCTALTVGSMALVHTVSALLNSIAILISAAGPVKGNALANPGFASCSIETARNLALRREHRIVMINSADLKDDSVWLDVHSIEPKRCSLAPAIDMLQFQKDFIDIIPRTWTAISIALSHTRKEISITRLEAGHSPFVLRLPLGRNNSIDADEEVFGFEQGHSEMLEIIQLADESARGCGEIIGPEAKNAWWEERGALDSRLRDLLENMEKVWLGGFSGIFSQHSRRPELLARFQKSFQNTLDKHLPSRQKTRRSETPRITLDSRILDLFVGLGDASDKNCDFSEPLTDLLYFVVDVLQFHGELNAYAEIDFDSIVVETHDALRGYHEAVRALNLVDESRHTVLILDKALHLFPWESLQCMDGLAVSRLPSLGCLRDRILEQQKDMPETSPAGHYVNRGSGSYILNPEGDLKNTEATFDKQLHSLQDWDGIIGRGPEENEIKSNLESKDIVLYFGHGSGAQFIRAREIRKLEKCAVTMLMGCSSGALTESGEFEPFGPPINYMHAGSPALVATLWDVTDKDIDRFFQRTFEQWGLFEKCGEQVSRKGKGKAKERKTVGAAKEQKRTSLVEAVARSRDACILKFLNAAAVVVYGVPVYIR